MADLTQVVDTLARDVLLQSTAIFAVGLLAARYVRLPARIHAVLTMTFVAAVLTPLASSVVRHGGWGILAPAATANSRMAHGEIARPQTEDTAKTEVAAAQPWRQSGRDESTARAEQPDRSGWGLLLRNPRQSAPRDIPAQDTPSQDNAPRSALETTIASAALPTETTTDNSGSALSVVAMIFAVAWLISSLIAVGCLLRGVLRGGRLMTMAEACSAETVEGALGVARERLALSNLTIDVFQSPSVRCPVIWCWGRRPRLVLPVDSVDRWSTADWTPILCHELAHWKRRDHLTALAAEIICCLAPWQLLAWWAKRQLEQASEQACDDWAVASGHSATDYAETLLGLVAQPGPPLQLAALRRKSSLGSRVRHILTERAPRPRLGRIWGMAIVTATAAIIGVAALCQRGVAAPDDNPKASPPPAPQPETKAAPEKKDAATEPAKGAAKDKPAAAPASNSKGSGVTGTFMRREPGMAAKGSANLGVSNGKAEGAAAPPKHFVASGRVLDPDGKPVAGAELFWEVRLKTKRDNWIDPPNAVAQTTSDAEGRYRIETDFVEQDLVYASLTARAAGFGLRSIATIPNKLDQPLDIQLDRSYPIEGSVFTPNGEPVQGAKVIVTQISRNSGSDDLDKGWYMSLAPSEYKSGTFRKHWPTPAVTDENGVFHFDDLVPLPATVQFIVDAKDFAPTHVRVCHAESFHHPREEDKNWRDPNFTLVLENPWVVEGRFIDEKTGAGIAGVELDVSPNLYSRGRHLLDQIHVKSDEDGHYKILVRSADYFGIQVRPPLGYPGINESINSTTLEKIAGKGRKVNYPVKLRPGVVLRGTVVADDTGAPVPNAEVIYRQENGRKIGANSEFTSVKTAADGSFELTGTNGKGFLLVDAPDQGFYRLAVDDKRAQRYEDATYPHGILELDVPETGSSEPFVVRLKRGSELVVRALSPSGEPVKKLVAAYAEQSMDRYFSSNETADGILRVNAAQPGRKYRFFLFSEDAMAGIVTEIEAPEDGHTIDVKLEPAATIRGRYVYAGGSPAPDVSNFPHFKIEPGQKPDNDNVHNMPFYYNFARHANEKGVSDADGNFELRGIVPGVFIYLALNYKFDDGKLYRAVGELAPGEVKDMGDLVIQSR